MTTRSDASSSDLERARALARRLRPEALLPAVRPPREEAPTAPYVHFEMPCLRPEAPPLRERLTRCLDLTDVRAIALFGVDGRPTAAVGEWASWSPTRIEAAGARLAVALDQAERLEGRWEGPRSIAMAVGPDWIVGLRVENGRERLALGLLVDRPLGQEAMSTLVRELLTDAGER